MRLVFTNDEFKIANAPVPRFPLLISKEGDIVEPAFRFLIHHLLHRGSVQSHRTWSTYGYFLLDYFNFLEVNGRTWDEPRLRGFPSVVAAFRRDALRRGSEPSTVSTRLQFICMLYEHALREGLISSLPFTLELRSFVRERRMGLASPTRATIQVPDVRLRVPRRRLKVLSGSQVEAFLSAFKNRTHKLIALVLLSTGLRVEEVVTLPASTVVDPRLQPSVCHLFPVVLNPLEMSTKGSISRVIHVPRSLMADLWAYAALDRPRRISPSSPGTFFLTEDGAQYTPNAIWYLCKKVGRERSLEVSPHVLRHTYASHTLAALSRAINAGNALLYVKNRLGHQSVKTTERYCHYVDDVADEVMNTYQQELLNAIAEIP